MPDGVHQRHSLRLLRPSKMQYGIGGGSYPCTPLLFTMLTLGRPAINPIQSAWLPSVVTVLCLYGPTDLVRPIDFAEFVSQTALKWS